MITGVIVWCANHEATREMVLKFAVCMLQLSLISSCLPPFTSQSDSLASVMISIIVLIYKRGATHALDLYPYYIPVHSVTHTTDLYIVLHAIGLYIVLPIL